jgi:hypothetical protein
MSGYDHVLTVVAVEFPTSLRDMGHPAFRCGSVISHISSRYGAPGFPLWQCDFPHLFEIWGTRLTVVAV